MKDEIIQIEGKFYQKCKVIMLPTNKPVHAPSEPGRYIKHISLFESEHPRGNKSLSFEKYMDGIEVPNVQHLYIVNNDPPQEGDWVYHPLVAQEYTVVRNGDIHSTGTAYYPAQGVFQWANTTNPWYKKARKIIATTDELLNKIPEGETHAYLYPRPSNDFLKKYCELGGIEEILVEYEGCFDYDYLCFQAYTGSPKEYDLKITPDNKIVIKPCKTTWTRDEVKDLLYKHTQYMLGGEGVSLEEWFDKNL